MCKLIGKLIKNKRLELGLSQAKLAKLMSFKSSGSIFKVEKGNLECITIEQLGELVKVLNLDLSEIYETEKNENNKFCYRLVINILQQVLEYCDNEVKVEEE